MTDHILELVDGFECGTASQWHTMTEKTLCGADFDKALVRRSEDGIKRGPLFTNIIDGSDVPWPFKTRPEHPWRLTSLIDHPDIIHANRDALADLHGGASALELQIDPTGKDGVSVQNRSDLARVLDGVNCEWISLRLTPTDTISVAALLTSLLDSEYDLTKTNVSLGCRTDSQGLVTLCDWVQENAAHWRAVNIDASQTHEAGATTAQELTAMLSQAVSVINSLLTGGMKIDTVMPFLDVRLAAPQDGHWGICKFRAARLLWAKMAKNYGAKDLSVHIHAVTSRRMLSKMDPWSNMLRLGSATFGAVCGGADSITTLPFTQPIGLATTFARRIARGQQLLLMEESHLGHVIDPASGSYTHETITHKICEKAWTLFQDMEKRGGWQQAKAWLAKQIVTARDTRTEKVKGGNIKLVGINQFTKPDVRKAEVLPRPEIKVKAGVPLDANDFIDAMAQAGNGHILTGTHTGQEFAPIRLSEPFENGDV